MKLNYLLICMCCMACLRPVLEHDLAKAELKSKVKSVRTLTTHFDDGKASRNKGPWDTYVLYNGAGQLVEKQGWGLNGRMTYHQEFVYDENAQLVGKKTYLLNRKLRDELVYRYDAFGNVSEEIFYNAAGEQVQRDVFVYNDHGNLTEKQTFRLGRLSDKVVYEYSATNQLLSTSKFDRAGNLEKKSIQRYRKGGRELEVLVVNEEQEELSRSLLLMDEAGRVLEEQRFHVGDSLAYKSKVFQYDKNGNEIDQVSYVLGKIAGRKSRLFDKKNRLIEEILLKSKGRFKSKERFAYDRKGALLKKVSYLEDGTVESTVTWTYSYDRHGNWVEQREFLDGVLQMLVVREVLYYK